jgi:hypothetical protein
MASSIDILVGTVDCLRSISEHGIKLQVLLMLVGVFAEEQEQQMCPPKYLVCALVVAQQKQGLAQKSTLHPGLGCIVCYRAFGGKYCCAALALSGRRLPGIGRDSQSEHDWSFFSDGNSIYLPGLR